MGREDYQRGLEGKSEPWTFGGTTDEAYHDWEAGNRARLANANLADQLRATETGLFQEGEGDGTGPHYDSAAETFGANAIVGLIFLVMRLFVAAFVGAGVGTALGINPTAVAVCVLVVWYYRIFSKRLRG